MHPSLGPMIDDGWCIKMEWLCFVGINPWHTLSTLLLSSNWLRALTQPRLSALDVPAWRYYSFPRCCCPMSTEQTMISLLYSYYYQLFRRTYILHSSTRTYGSLCTYNGSWWCGVRSTAVIEQQTFLETRERSRRMARYCKIDYSSMMTTTPHPSLRRRCMLQVESDHKLRRVHRRNTTPESFRTTFELLHEPVIIEVRFCCIYTYSVYIYIFE